MLANLVLCVYIFFILFILGVFVREMVCRFFPTAGSSGLHIPLDHLLLSGFVFLTVILSFTTLVSKIGMAVHLVVLAFTLGSAIFYRKQVLQLVHFYGGSLNRNKNVYWIFALFCPFFLLMLFHSASDIRIYDSQLYHAQFIQWIQKYKVVPGLVWIHERFAFNSQFHISCAFFCPSFLGIKDAAGVQIAFYPLNVFFFFMFLLRCVVGIYKGIRDQDTFDVSLYSLLFLLVFPVYTFSIQSPTPDTLTAILVMYIFFMFLDKRKRVEKETSWSYHDLLLLSFIFFLPTLKVSAGMIVVLLPFLVLRFQLSLRAIMPVIILGAIIITPFLIRNVILSGWLLYPFAHLDLFNVDWKIDAERTQLVSDNIKSWAMVSGVPRKEVLAMPFSKWVPMWWERFPRYSNPDYFLMRMLILAVIGPVVLLVLYFFNKNRRQFFFYQAVSFVILVNLCFWFLSAPDPRFAMGFIFMGGAFIVSAIIAELGNSRIISLTVLAVVFRLFVWELDIDAYLDGYLSYPERREEILVYPKQMKATTEFEYVKNIKGDLIVAKPVGNYEDRCFGLDIPCGPTFDVNILLRGNSLEDGFTYYRK